jgi:hypothetical protein
MNHNKNGKTELTANKKPPAITGERLKHLVMSTTLAPLRETRERKRTRRETHDAAHEAIEKVLLSGEYRAAFEKVRDAFVLEQAPALLAELIEALQRRRAWAWRAFLDATGIAGLLRAVSDEAGELDFPHDPAGPANRAALADLKSLMRRKDDRQHSEQAESIASEK